MSDSVVAHGSQAKSAPGAAEADFEALLGRVLGPALGTALRLARNREDAEDLVQEAALRAFRSFATFQQGSNFNAWFFRILMNCFYARHRKQRPESSLDGLEDSHELYLYEHALAAGVHRRDADPAVTAVEAIGVERVAAALDQLPEEHRVVCTLYFMQDFAYQEIADLLGVPLGTVRSRLHRGRRMLQKRLWQLADDQGFTSHLKPHPAEVLS
jgi:RNA polymerase sigma-70 factor (ECF subfamily)